MGAARFANLIGVLGAMTNSEAKNTDNILAGEYALGLLSGEENTKFEVRLGAEPQLRRYYTDWLEDFVALTDDIGEVAPPIGFYAGLEKRLFAAPPAPTKSARGGSLVRFVLGGALAVVALLVILVLYTAIPSQI